MTSMTGYSYKEVSNEDYTLSVEIKSVNSRFLDVSINLPFYLGRLESYFKDLITSNIQRGKIDVFVRLKENNSSISVSVDKNAVKAYYNAFMEIGKICNLVHEVPLSLIASQEGVITNQKEIDMDHYLDIIEPVFKEALDCIVIDRKREGENLKKDILLQLGKIEDSAEFFTKWQPQMESEFKKNITAKFEEVCGDKIDEQRILTEVASMLVKYTINEEIVRLKSHISALRHEIENNPTPGKRIDFICQEMNREINTIGSKNQFVEVGKEVISAKDALENIREQSKNVE